MSFARFRAMTAEAVRAYLLAGTEVPAPVVFSDACDASNAPTTVRARARYLSRERLAAMSDRELAMWAGLSPRRGEESGVF